MSNVGRPEGLSCFPSPAGPWPSLDAQGVHSPLQGAQDARRWESREAAPPDLLDPWGRGEGGMNQLLPSAAAPPGRTAPSVTPPSAAFRVGSWGRTSFRASSAPTGTPVPAVSWTSGDPATTLGQWRPGRELGRQRPGHDPGLAETRPQPWAGGDQAVSWASGDLAVKWAGGDPTTTLGRWRPGR